MPSLAAFEELVQNVYDALSDGSVEFVLYNPKSPELSPRQVVFAPGKFKCTTALEANTGGTSQDTLFTELLVVDVEHHGTDLADTCDLHIRVANAIRRVFRNSSDALEGYYQNADPKDDSADPFSWNSASVLVQRYIWKINIPRLEAATYLAKVKEIDIVERTQITTTVDGVLTPAEQLEIKE